MSLIQQYVDTVATAASYTNGVNLGSGEFNRFTVVFPSTSPLTAAGDISAQVSHDGTTYYGLASEILTSATSTLVNVVFSRTSWGTACVSTAPRAARYFRLKFGTAATNAATFYYWAGK